MNLADLHKTITEEYAHKIAEWQDTINYSYMVECFKLLKERGEDPTNFEVIFIRDEFPERTDNGLKITHRIQLRKITP